MKKAMIIAVLMGLGMSNSALACKGHWGTCPEIELEPTGPIYEVVDFGYLWNDNSVR